MRTLIALILALVSSLVSNPLPCQAGVLASPVVIEAQGVQAGDEFQIRCTNITHQTQDVELSLALFDQAQDGRVFFHEDTASKEQAERILTLTDPKLRLNPNETRLVSLQVNEDKFDSAYVVLFIRPLQPRINSRLAVLLLLSASDSTEAVDISDVNLEDGFLSLTFRNHGDRHGSFDTTVWCYDKAGSVVDKLDVSSGRVLPQRSRSIALDLPESAELISMGSHPDGPVQISSLRAGVTD